MKEACGYCGGTGEVPEDSIRYMHCPACDGTGEKRENAEERKPRKDKNIVRLSPRQEGIPFGYCVRVESIARCEALAS